MPDLNTRLVKFLNGLVSGTPTIENVGGGTQSGGVTTSIFTSTSAVANGTTVETDLLSYAMPAGTLGADAQKVRITAWGTMAANANTKTLRMYFGASVVSNQGTTGSGLSWVVTAVVARTGAATQVATGVSMISTIGQIVTATSPTETLSGAVTIKITGQSSAASADITSAGMMVEWVP